MKMVRLPLELVSRIFDEIHRSESDGLFPYDWFALSKQHNRFFSRAALVCRDWYRLARGYRTTFTVSQSGWTHLVAYWYRALARDGQQLVHSTPILNLHIEAQVQDLAAYWHTFRASDTLARLLAISASSLTSLSLQSEFFEVGTTLSLRKAMHTVLSKIARLHIYSYDPHTTAYSEYTFPGRNFSWIRLLDLICSPARKVPLKELQLSYLAIDLPDEYPNQACPAEIVVLRDATFQRSRLWSKLFPCARQLVLRQTTKWHHSFDHEAWEGEKEEKASFGLHFDAFSTSLKHLQVIWEPLPKTSLVHYPLRYDPDILQSPNLETIHIRAISEDRTIPRTKMGNKRGMPLLDLAGYKILKCQNLTINGIDRLFGTKKFVRVCKAFRKPGFFPNLQAIPNFTLERTTRLSKAEKKDIGQGLAGLKARGLRLYAGDLETTVWKLARE